MVVTSQSLPLRQDTTFFRRAKRISTPYFLLYWEMSPSNFVPQLSIIVPKHHVKTSVKRHQLKRRLKNCVANAGLGTHLNLVFVMNRKATTLTFAELQSEVQAALRLC